MNDFFDNSSPKGKTPSYIAYHVRNRKGSDGIWTRIGSAWPHADGKGFNIQSETLPVDGRISLRLRNGKAE